MSLISVGGSLLCTDLSVSDTVGETRSCSLENEPVWDDGSSSDISGPLPPVVTATKVLNVD